MPILATAVFVTNVDKAVKNVTVLLSKLQMSQQLLDFFSLIVVFDVVPGDTVGELAGLDCVLCCQLKGDFINQ